MKTFTVLIIVAILFSCKLFGQSEYSKYIVVDSHRKTHFVKNEYGDEKINYLGVIKKQMATAYTIFLQFLAEFKQQ